MSDTQPHRLDRLQALFQAASDLPAGERKAFLRRECGSDTALLERVLALLEADESDLELRDIVEHAVRDALEEPATSLLNRRVGNYRLIRSIGQGGMGSVFLAERVDEQFRHRVAIKVLPPGRADEQLVRRFRSERQVLANLDHPNIAKLLDGGETSDGLPYLVMEYVDGEQIDAYCDRQQLDLRARLRLFQKVCLAVDYAHRNLVVHRDVKPSNILVGPDGEPKLLDFGIAKLLDESALELTAAVTREGTTVMTPEFASPEQVRGEPISTATDVYSMGVLLYKLLCGQMPYRLRDNLPSDLARAIVEDEPSRPSTVVTKTQAPATTAPSEPSAELEDVPARRGTTISGLRNALRGDLDNVVLKALRKEPERRYLSASAFHRDIDDYLGHRPVAARPASLLYRASKFVRRNRVGVVTAAVVLALLTAAAVQVVQQRDRAAIAAEQSEQVTKFLVSLFAHASPAETLGEAVSVQDLLAEGVREIDSLDDQPAVQARLLDIMGSSYSWLGDEETATRLLERSLQLRETRLPTDRVATAKTLKDLADSLRQQRELDVALALFERGADLLRVELGPRSSELAYIEGRIGEALRMQGRLPEARARLEGALAMKRELRESGDSDAIDIEGNLALVLDDMGFYDEAARVQEAVVDASRRTDGDGHPNTIIRVTNLGLIRNRQGRLDAALGHFDEADAYAKTVWRSDQRVATWIAIGRAGVLRGLGRFEEAEGIYADALEFERGTSGTGSVRYARNLRRMALLRIDRHELPEALALIDASRTAAVEVGSPRHEGYAWLQAARAYNALGRLPAAEDAARRAVELLADLDEVSTLVARRELAVSLSGQGRRDAADREFTEVRLALGDATGPVYLDHLLHGAAMSRHYRRTGRPEQALPLAQDAHRIGAAVTPAGTWRPALAAAEYGLALAANGDVEAGEGILREALAALRATFGDGDPRVIALAEALAELQGGDAA